MNIQFFHQMHGDSRFTVAVQVPTVSGFMHLLSKPTMPNLLLVGTARCSRVDQFVKKTGRELATERMAPLSVKFARAEIKDNILFVALKNMSEEGPQNFYFRVNLTSTKPHFLGV